MKIVTLTRLNLHKEVQMKQHPSFRQSSVTGCITTTYTDPRLYPPSGQSPQAQCLRKHPVKCGCSFSSIKSAATLKYIPFFLNTR